MRIKVSGKDRPEKNKDIRILYSILWDYTVYIYSCLCYERGLIKSFDSMGVGKDHLNNVQKNYYNLTV